MLLSLHHSEPVHWPAAPVRTMLIPTLQVRREALEMLELHPLEPAMHVQQAAAGENIQHYSQNQR